MHRRPACLELPAPAGKLAFDVRVNGKVARIMSSNRVGASFEFVAILDAKVMSLQVNGKEIAKGKSPGLIPVQPKDGMNIGHDALSAAGDYEPPNVLRGTVKNLKVESGRQPSSP